MIMEKYKMQKNKELELLCGELREWNPGLEAMINRFKSHPNFREGDTYRFDFLLNCLERIYLDSFLESKIGKYNIDLDSRIKRTTMTKDFIFRFDKVGRLYPKHKETEWEYSRIDRLVLVNNLPVAFFIRLARYTVGRKRSSVNKQLKQIDKKLEPLIQFYKENMGIGYIGCVMIVSNEPYHQHTPVSFDKFIQKNGILVPFYTDRQTFRKDVREQATKYGIKIEEQQKNI